MKLLWTKSELFTKTRHHGWDLETVEKNNIQLEFVAPIDRLFVDAEQFPEQQNILCKISDWCRILRP